MRERVKKNKRIRVTVILIILIILCYISINKFIINRNITNQTKNILETIKIDETKITETKTERMLKLEELQKDNPDIVAWLEIEGTNISYPVLQDTDNSYYMTHNYKKEYSKDGSIFLDKDYDWNIPSTNLLIYGHNYNDGLMFASLLDYKQESFYKEHQIIKLTTNKEDTEYEIIAAFLSKVYYKSETNVFRYYFFINAKTEEEFNEYITNSKKASLYDTGKTAKYGDQLLTLSTCSYHTEDGRFAVVARKIK